MTQILEVWEDLPLLMTPAETAHVLRLSVEHVKRELRAGRLPGRKIGAKVWRIPRDQLRAWTEDATADAEGAGAEPSPPTG